LSKCPRCGGELRVIGAITEPGVIRRILDAYGPKWTVAGSCAAVASEELARPAVSEKRLSLLSNEAIVEAHAPELLFISNLLFPDGSKVGGLSNSEVVWHTDLIYRAHPASGTIFYGIEMPDGTGQTSYCNMAHAYRTLPEDLRSRANGAQARCKLFTDAPLSMSMRPHRAEGYQLETQSDAGAQAIDERTPVVIQNLVVENASTGERSLYMSPNHTTALEGLCEEEARALFDALLEHALQPENIYCHQWRNGDVVLWDNVRLLHRRESFGDHTPRLAKRTTVYMDPKYFAVSRGETATPV
jgi:taurine dioxygenase